LLGLFQSHRIDILEAEMEALRQLVDQTYIEEVVEEEQEIHIDPTLQCQLDMIAQMQTLTNTHIAQRLALQSCD
jgi:hypothetical protein